MNLSENHENLCRDCPFPFRHSEPLINYAGGNDTPFPLTLLGGGDNPFPLQKLMSSSAEVLQAADQIRSIEWVSSNDIDNTILLVATGQFASTGWTCPVLLERTYVTFPTDGIIDFDFAAIKSSRQNFALTFLRATSEIKRDSNIKGVRVHSKNNALEAILP